MEMNQFCQKLKFGHRYKEENLKVVIGRSPDPIHLPPNHMDWQRILRESMLVSLYRFCILSEYTSMTDD